MEENKGVLYTSIESGSVVDRIFHVIVTAIIEGELKPGDRLPTENELCQNLHVGRNSVREAIKKLEAYGIVYIRRADGTYVSETYSQKMLDPMLYGIILQKNSWNDFVDLRRVIDIGTLYLVIRRGDTKELTKRLEACTEELKEKIEAMVPSAEDVMEADTRFHSAIADATKNEMIKSITRYITRITVQSRLKTIERVLEKGETKNFIELHRQMVQVIEQGDLGGIESAVIDHYVYWQQEKNENQTKEKEGEQ